MITFVLSYIESFTFTYLPNGDNVGKLFVKRRKEMAIELYNKYVAEKRDMIFTSDDEC